MQTMSGRAAIKKINKLVEIFWLIIPIYVMINMIVNVNEKENSQAAQIT